MVQCEASLRSTRYLVRPRFLAALLLALLFAEPAVGEILDHGLSRPKTGDRTELLDPFFITSRAIDLNSDGHVAFTHERGPLQFGTSTVQARWRRGHAKVPTLAVQTMRPQSQVAFAQKLDQKVAASDLKAVFVLFPGFGMTHNDNLELAGGMQAILRCKMPVVVYSPPTQGSRLNPFNYARDITNFDWVLDEGHVKSALLAVLRLDHVERVYLLGHSLGSRLINVALSQIAKSSDAELLRKIKLISLAAPDLQISSFDRRLLSVVRTYRVPLTVYLNPNDRALWLANFFLPEPRVGSAVGNDLFLRDWVTTIDATDVDTHPFNHLDLLGNRIGSDVFYAVCSQIPPEKRQLDRFRNKDGVNYYRLRP